MTAPILHGVTIIHIAYVYFVRGEKRISLTDIKVARFEKEGSAIFYLRQTAENQQRLALHFAAIPAVGR